jgi:hypothetical protein
VVVTYRKGAPVRIRDIGRAVDGAEDTRLATWANDKRAIRDPFPPAGVFGSDRRFHAARDRFSCDSGATTAWGMTRGSEGAP